MNRARVFLFVGLAWAPAAVAQDLTPALDSAFAPWNRTDAPGCTAGVRQGDREYQRAWGMANLEYGVRLEPGSVLETGSVAKQFTAAAVVLLALDGKLSLEDDVRKYVPEVPDFGTTITLRHLLNHTSGLRDQWALYGIMGTPPGIMVHTIPGVLHLLSRQRMLNFTPGAEYLYSNMGYVLLGVVVSRVSGQSLESFSQDRLFGPLEMTSTRWRDDYRKVVPGRATAYERSGSGWLQDMPFTMVHGNGGLLTTVGDLLRWNAALTDGTIPGGAELVRQLETRGRLNDGTTLDYALGLSVGGHRGTREVSHGGSTAGYRTFLARYPDQQLSIAILCNVANVNPAQLGHQIADAMLGTVPDAPPRPAVIVAPEVLASMAGAYRDTTADQFLTLAVAAGRLTVSSGGPTTPLTPIGDNQFWSPVAGTFQLVRAGNGWRIGEGARGPRVYLPFVRVADGAVPTADYVGSYHSAELDVTIEVRLERGRLLLLRPPGSLPALVPSYPDGFRAGGFTVRFARNPAGQVTTLRIFAGRARDVRFDRQP